MQARCRGVEADIAGDALAPEQLVERSLVGRLVDEAARLKLDQEVRFNGAHGRGRLADEALLSQSLLSQAWA